MPIQTSVKWRGSGCRATPCFASYPTAIEQIAALFRAGKLPPEEFARQFVPRLQFMLDQLNVHHQIEDLHYFPIFRAADERLARGFDVLEGDHHHIHADMARTAETANALLALVARWRRYDAPVWR